MNHHLEPFLDQLFQPPWRGQVAYHGLNHWFAYTFGSMITLWESTIPSERIYVVPVDVSTSSMENKEFCWHVTRWLSSHPSITGANVLIHMAWKDRWITNETQGVPLVFVGDRICSQVMKPVDMSYDFETFRKWRWRETIGFTRYDYVKKCLCILYDYNITISSFMANPFYIYTYITYEWWQRRCQ